MDGAVLTLRTRMRGLERRNIRRSIGRHVKSQQIQHSLAIGVTADEKYDEHNRQGAGQFRDAERLRLVMVRPCQSWMMTHRSLLRKTKSRTPPSGFGSLKACGMRG